MKKYKIIWKEVLNIIIISVVLTLTIQDIVKIIYIPIDKFNNKILFVAQLSAGFLFFFLYLLTKQKRILEVKKK